MEMTILRSLSESMPHGPVLFPAASVMGMASLRYCLVSGLIFMLARGSHGRQSLPWQRRARKHQLMHEIKYSALSIIVFGLVSGLLYGYGVLTRHMYFDVSEHGWIWFFCSILLMLLIHDTLFYWMHRLVHWKFLFRQVHKVHHQSVYPTAWASYSFHPWEAVLETLIAVSVFLILPTHPIAFMIFQFLSMLINAYGHCGREYHPLRWETHPIGRWINTPGRHSLHHVRSKHNYGLYFLFWDRWMGTLAPVNNEKLIRHSVSSRTY